MWRLHADKTRTCHGFAMETHKKQINICAVSHITLEEGDKLRIITEGNNAGNDYILSHSLLTLICVNSCREQKTSSSPYVHNGIMPSLFCLSFFLQSSCSKSSCFENIGYVQMNFIYIIIKVYKWEQNPITMYWWLRIRIDLHVGVGKWDPKNQESLNMALHSQARGNLCSEENTRSDQLASRAFFLSKWRSMKSINRELPLLLWFWFSMQLAPWHVDQLKGILKLSDPWHKNTHPCRTLWWPYCEWAWWTTVARIVRNSVSKNFRIFYTVDIPCSRVSGASEFTAHVCCFFCKTNRALLCRGRD